MSSFTPRLGRDDLDLQLQVALEPGQHVLEPNPRECSALAQAFGPYRPVSGA